jgi:GNAT superfamily N-acetyltransferase
MADVYDIALATPDDIPGILALQELNLPAAGGNLSVRMSADWFHRALLEMPLVIARRDDTVVGYVAATSLAANLHIAIVQAMLRDFPAPDGCYIYGPICISAAERGKGLAGALFDHLRANLPGRPAMTFIRADNAPSLRAHEKMRFVALGTFTNDGIGYVALSCPGR